ncbi:MAG: cell division protein FtsA [Acidobacteria bacterium]|nr:cell division protein FtsA [Acidobacteriota bacterium]
MPRKQDYLVGLDLGSGATRCVVALEEDSRLRFISHGVVPTAGGWDKGVISDQDVVLESLEKAIEDAEKNGGMMVEAAVVGVGGPHLRSNVSHAALNLNSWENQIERRHVDEVIKRASQAPLSEDRVVLQAVPLEFAVDQQPGKRNPLGMNGRRLDAHVQVVSALAQAHDNIQAVVNRAGVVVEETVSEGFAAAYAVLEEQERDIGVAVCDLGAGSIELVVYLDNDLRLTTGIPIAGEHFVSDVASVLRTPREAAQRLIEQYGCVLPEQTPPNVTIETPDFQGGSQQRPRRLLNQILEARAEEVFELIGDEIKRAGFANRLVGGAVLTGSLACMAGLCDLAEKSLGVEARVGLPPRIEDLPDELDHPGWATALGLVLYAQRLRLHKKRRRESVAEWLKALFEG